MGATRFFSAISVLKRAAMHGNAQGLGSSCIRNENATRAEWKGRAIVPLSHREGAAIRAVMNRSRGRDTAAPPPLRSHDRGLRARGAIGRSPVDFPRPGGGFAPVARPRREAPSDP